LRKLVGDEKFTPVKYQDIVNQLFVTAYLSTKNSSEDTNSRSKRLAESIGSQHFCLGIDEAYDSILNIFSKSTGLMPKF